MKPRVSISRLSIRLGLFFLLTSVPQLLSAQEDSIRISYDNIQLTPVELFPLPPLELFPEKGIVSPLYPSGEPAKLPDFSLKGDIRLPYYTNPSPRFRGDFQTAGLLKQFPHGVIFGSGEQMSVPGIGRFNVASLGYQHAFNDKLALQVRANAMKINMTHFSGQTFSASGTLLYHASDRITFKAFGSYDISNPYGMSTNLYGISMSVDMTERFGMEFGVQRYYDAMRGRWETVPMVIPYYRFDKFTLGLDVGGLLYEILREAIFDKRDNSGPTIMPPRMSIPIRDRW